MPKKTRKQDAASIVGNDLAEEIEAKSKISTQRSDALVEMSETEPTAEETQELINEIEPKQEEAESQNETVSELSAVEKFEDATMDAAVNSPAEYVPNLPYGGAISMKDAEDYVAAKNEAIYLMDMWSVFSNVVWNIMDRLDVPDKRAALNSAVDEFKNVLTAKAMVVFSASDRTEPIVQLSVDTHELQPALDVLLDAIDNSLDLDVDMAGKLNSINPALAEFGNHISEYVSVKSQVQNPVPQNPNADILVEIKSLIQPLAEKIGILTEDVNTLKSQTRASEVPVKNRIPVPRTLRSDQVIAPAPPVVKSETPKLSSIIRKSVGISE